MIPEQNMNTVAGFQSANRRLAKLGVEDVDLTLCDHGAGTSCLVNVRGVNHRVSVHGAKDHLTALDQLCDEISALRRRGGLPQ